MTKIIDLSMPLSPATTPPLDYPHLAMEPLRSHDRDDFQSGKICMAIHTGTHVDAPFHFYKDGIPIDQVSLERLIGPGKVVDLRGKVGSQEFITIEHLEGSVTDSNGVRGLRLLLYTGWAEHHWDQDSLYSLAPHLDEKAGEYLRDLGIAALGVDFPVDAGVPFPVHLVLLGADIPLIENIVNLGELVGREFTLVAAPVKLAGGDGSPARVLALVQDDG